MKLPDVYRADLGQAQLAALLCDLRACAEHLEVFVKGHSEEHATEARLRLEDVPAALRSSAIRGVQFRYTYRGKEWVDTLMRSADGSVSLTRL